MIIFSTIIHDLVPKCKSINTVEMQNDTQPRAEVTGPWLLEPGGKGIPLLPVFRHGVGGAANVEI